MEKNPNDMKAIEQHIAKINVSLHEVSEIKLTKSTKQIRIPQNEVKQKKKIDAQSLYDIASKIVTKIKKNNK